MLDARRMRALQAVAAEGSIASAAAVLGYTPSAVSQSIAALERYLGLAVLDRGAHGVSLTAAGERLVEHADVILAHLQAAETEARALDGRPRATPVRLATFASGAPLVVRAAADIAHSAPATRMTIVAADADRSLPALRIGELDIALIAAYDFVAPAWPGWLELIPVLEDPVLAVLPAAHSLARGERVALAALAREAFIVEPGAEFIESACRQAGFEPAIAASSSDYRVTLGLVAAGVGVSLVPRMAATGASGVVAIPLEGPVVGRQVSAATRVGNARVPATAAVLAALRRAGAQDPRS